VRPVTDSFGNRQRSGAGVDLWRFTWLENLARHRFATRGLAHSPTLVGALASLGLGIGITQLCSPIRVPAEHAGEMRVLDQRQLAGNSHSGMRL
jgi:hypothetical protein